MDSDFIFFLTIPTFRFAYASESVAEVLGFEQEQMHQLSLVDLLTDEEQDDVISALTAAVEANKTAIVFYLQLLHRQGVFVVCQMSVSIAGNVIVGSIARPELATIGRTARDQTAEEVIVAAIDLIDHPGMVGYPAMNWTGTQFPRTVLLLERFESDLDITHCTNNAILDSETCVGQTFFNYVADRDEDSVESFISSVRSRSAVGADTPANSAFAYHVFTLNVAGYDPSNIQSLSNGANEVRVSALGYSSTDGLILVLKREY